MASGGPEEFRIWVKRLGKKDVPDWERKVHGAIHQQLADGLIFRTPVGYPPRWKSKPPPGYVGGRARGNWQSSATAPKGGETGRIDPSGGASRAEARAAAQAIRPYSQSFITNNVPYIVGENSLNDGHSQQAPKKFIEQAIETVAEQFNRGR